MTDTIIVEPSYSSPLADDCSSALAVLLEFAAFAQGLMGDGEGIATAEELAEHFFATLAELEDVYTIEAESASLVYDPNAAPVPTLRIEWSGRSRTIPMVFASMSDDGSDYEGVELDDGEPTIMVPSWDDPKEWKGAPLGFSFRINDCEIWLSVHFDPAMCVVEMAAPTDTSTALTVQHRSVRADVVSIEAEFFSGEDAGFDARDPRCPDCSGGNDPQGQYLLPPPSPQQPGGSPLGLVRMTEIGTDGQLFRTDMLPPGITFVRLYVRFAGDVPDLRLAWEDAAAPPLPSPPNPLLLPERMPPIDGDGQRKAFVADWGLSRERALCLRNEWSTAPSPTPSQLAHRILLAIEHGSAGSASEVLLSVLTAQYFRRGRLALEASAAATPPLLETEPHDLVRDFEGFKGQLAATLGAMKGWLTDPESWISSPANGPAYERIRTWRDVADAFLLFGCGRTTAFGAHGAPNGVNMFCFAELAFLAQDLASELEPVVAGDVLAFWARLEPALAAACCMFVDCYHDGKGRKICSYRASNNPVALGPDGLAHPRVKPARSYALGEARVMEQQWRAMGPAGRRRMFGRVVGGALAEEILGPPSLAVVSSESWGASALSTVPVPGKASPCGCM